MNICDCSDAVSFEILGLLINNKERKGNVLAEDIFKRIPLFYCFIKIDKEFESFQIDPIPSVSLLLKKSSCNRNV